MRGFAPRSSCCWSAGSRRLHLLLRDERVTSETPSRSRRCSRRADKIEELDVNPPRAIARCSRRPRRWRIVQPLEARRTTARPPDRHQPRHSKSSASSTKGRGSRAVRLSAPASSGFKRRPGRGVASAAGDKNATGGEVRKLPGSPRLPVSSFLESTFDKGRSTCATNDPVVRSRQVDSLEISPRTALRLRRRATPGG